MASAGSCGLHMREMPARNPAMDYTGFLGLHAKRKLLCAGLVSAK
ncbi:MAG TPA: hypothetical protein VFI29_15205 [Hanamia sp.]|nr:hypothetical protein [Hanamia sp.]